MKDFAEAGIRFKAFLATWHAWLNNKFGGDLSLIRKAADLFSRFFCSQNPRCLIL
jgi:tyrosyl-tRNA synthetase